MGSDGELVRGRQRADALAFGDAARDGDVGLQDVDGAGGDQIAESEARLLVLARRDRDVGGAAYLGEPRRVVRRDRLLEPGEIIWLDLAREAERVAHAPRAMRVDHDSDLAPGRLAHFAHAPRGVADAGVLKADAHLPRAGAPVDVLGQLLADGADRRPPAAGIRR